MLSVCAYDGVVRYFWRFSFLYEFCCDVFVLWLIFVCVWVGGDLFVMGCCVVVLSVVVTICVIGASPVRFVLSLFYLCAFQMKPVCVVCVITYDSDLFLVYMFVTEVTHPYDWSVFVCVCRRARI